MNLFFRFLRIIISARFFRARVRLLDETRVTFTVSLTDLDVLWHMNNGKYFSLMDLGRFDMLIRTGLARALKENGWYPVVASETIRFRSSLKLFDRVELRTRNLGWDEKSFYVYQEFISKGATCAVAIVRARFLAKAGGTLAAATVVNAVSPGITSPPLPEYIAMWRTADDRFSTGK